MRMEYNYVEDKGFVLDPETTEESLASNITMAFIASILSVPGIVSADRLSRSIPSNPTPVQVEGAIKKACEKAPTFGGYSAIDATNLLARTIFAEAAGESREGKKMVATVIWNRAGGDSQKLIKVCLAKAQFSCWRKANMAKLKPGVYKVRIPSDILIPKVRTAWDDCKNIAAELLAGTFTPLGNYNAYLNPETADSNALATWGTSMLNQKTVGKHRFGYLREHDPSRKKVKLATYTVKKGDNIGKIATNLISNRKTSITNVQELTNQIIAVNKLKDNGNKIFIGQVLKLPQGVNEDVSENRRA